MAFRLVRNCDDNTALLESDEAKPVFEPRALFLGNRRVGRILETIGRVSKPLFVAKLDGRLAEGTVLE